MRPSQRIVSLLDRLGPWPPLLVWMLLIYLFSDRPDIPQVGSSLLDFVVKKGLHALAYGILAGLWWRALVSLALRRPRLWAFAASLAYAASDEWHQRFVPGRHGQPRDVLIDGLGAAVAMLWLARRRP
jgi:VanZ family protein